MTYQQKLAKALEYNKVSTIIFYGMKYAPGALIEFERFMGKENRERLSGESNWHK